MRLLLTLILNALALIITSKIVPGFVISDFGTAILAAIVLGLINTFIRPILLFLTAPLNFLTLGLFTFVVNAIVLEMVAVVPGVKIYSFGSALLAALALAIISTILSTVLQDIEKVGNRSRQAKGR